MTILKNDELLYYGTSMPGDFCSNDEPNPTPTLQCKGEEKQSFTEERLQCNGSTLTLCTHNVTITPLYMYIIHKQVALN